jgi:hypothetical protein
MEACSFESAEDCFVRLQDLRLEAAGHWFCEDEIAVVVIGDQHVVVAIT